MVYYAYNQFTEDQLQEMQSYFVNARWEYLGISTFFMITSLVSRAYRWKYALNYMGYFPKFHNQLMAVSVGYLVNFTIPRSGEISRALVMQKYENIAFDKGFGTIVSERVIDLVCLLLLVATAFFSQYYQLKDFLSEKIPFQQLLLFGSIGFLLFVVGIYCVFYSKWKVFLWIKNKISGWVEGLMSIFKMRSRGGFLFNTFIIWLSYVLSFYFGTFAIDVTAGMSFGVVLVAFVVGSLAISFTNGGFGAFPLLISEILVLYGIAYTAGTTFGWILWTSQTVVFILAGALSFLLLPILNRKKI